MKTKYYLIWSGYSIFWGLMISVFWNKIELLRTFNIVLACILLSVNVAYVVMIDLGLTDLPPPPTPPKKVKVNPINDKRLKKAKEVNDADAKTHPHHKPEIIEKVIRI